MAQKPRHEFPSLLIALALGMVATVMQILVLRELLSLSHGNELIFTLALGVWLALVAAGSGIGDLLTQPQRWFERRGRLAISFLVTVSCLLPLWIAGVRFLPDFLGLGTGELLGPWQLLLVVLLYLSIPCLILGMTFPYAATLYREQGGGTLAYLWEGIGSTIGGLGLVVAFRVGIDPLSIACVVAATGCVLASPLSQIIGSQSSMRAATAPAILLLLLSITGFAHLADDVSKQYGSFPQYALIKSIYSPYGNLAVVARQNELSLYDNGSLLAGGNAPQTSEPLPHIALSAVKSLHRVLIFGGGPSGILGQALKHNPTQIDYVELDGDVARLAKDPLGTIPDDSRLNTVTADPRRFLLQNPDVKYDAIILAQGEPITLLAGRVYTCEAFQAARSKLSNNGVLAFEIHGAENYLPPKAATYVASIISAARKTFSRMDILPGQPIIVLAYANPAQPPLDADSVHQTLHMRGIEPIYLNRGVLWERFDPLRIDKFSRAIVAAQGQTESHSDLNPVAFRTDLLRWSEMMAEPMAPLESNALPGWALVLVPLLPVAAFITWGRIAGRRVLRGAGMSWITGFCSMTGVIVTLYIYQIAVGSLYMNLALLTAVSMFGLGLGAFLGRRSRGARAALISSLMLSLPLLLLTWQLPMLRTLPSTLASTLILVIAFLAGGGTGAGFAASCGTALGGSAGFIYAMDVAGAALAAIWSALVILPLGGLGMVATSGLILVGAFMVLAIWEWISYQYEQ